MRLTNKKPIPRSPQERRQIPSQSNEKALARPLLHEEGDIANDREQKPGVTMSTNTLFEILGTESHNALVSLREMPSHQGAVRRAMLDKWVRELSARLMGGEAILYNRLAATGEVGKELALEMRERHTQLTRQLLDLNTMRPEDERFAVRVLVLTEALQQFVDVEEKRSFPLASEVFSESVLDSLAGEYVVARDGEEERSTMWRLGQERLRGVADDVRHLISPTPTPVTQ